MGQRINIQTAAYPEKVFAGTVINIDPVVDPVSRTLAVRAVIENPSLLLKPQMFVTIDLLEKPVLQTSYYVPSESVVTVQGQQAVFIKKENSFSQYMSRLEIQKTILSRSLQDCTLTIRL